MGNSENTCDVSWRLTDMVYVVALCGRDGGTGQGAHLGCPSEAELDTARHGTGNQPKPRDCEN